MGKAIEDINAREDTWQAPPKYARPVFLGITALYWLSLYFYVPILSPYVEHQGGSLRMVGLVVSAYGLVQLLTSPRSRRRSSSHVA